MLKERSKKKNLEACVLEVFELSCMRVRDCWEVLFEEDLTVEWLVVRLLLAVLGVSKRRIGWFVVWFSSVPDFTEG